MMRTLSMGFDYAYTIPSVEGCAHTVTAWKRAVDSERYSEALLRELDCRAPMFDGFGHLETIYIGGGTPSLWSISSLKRLNKLGMLPPKMEITLEVNPKTSVWIYSTGVMSGLTV